MNTTADPCTARCGDPATHAIAGDPYCKECFLELRYGVIPPLRRGRPSSRVTRLDLIRSAPPLGWSDLLRGGHIAKAAK